MKTTTNNIFKNIKYDENFNNELKIGLYQVTKDEEILERIILNNIPLVIKIANIVAYATKIDHDDLIQEGLIALINSIKNYKGDGTFSTYAYECIFGVMHVYVRTEYCHSSASYGQFMKKFNSIGYELYDRCVNYYKEPYLTEVLNVMVDRNIISEKHKPIIRSIIPISFEENRKMCTNVMYDETDDNFKEIYREIGENLDYLLSGLDDIDKNIVKLKTGFYNDEPLSLTEIGSLYGKSHEFVRTHYLRSLPKIKKKYDSLS